MENSLQTDGTGDQGTVAVTQTETGNNTDTAQSGGGLIAPQLSNNNMRDVNIVHINNTYVQSAARTDEPDAVYPRTEGDSSRRSEAAGDSQGVVMIPLKLLNTLEDLIEEEFKAFKWYLRHYVLEGYQPIKALKLEKAARQDTVDLMVQTYECHGALRLTKKVLEKINRRDLVQSLSDTS